MCSRTKGVSRQKPTTIGLPTQDGHASFPTKTGQWYRAGSLGELYMLLKENADKRTRLVAGNTANGVPALPGI